MGSDLSGVIGIVNLDGAAISSADLDRQKAALKHLGPDRATRWAGGNAGLGALLMRVTGEDRFDRQPIREAGLVFVSDARIDNREDVAAKLGIDDATLRDMPDSALLFAAFRHWRDACVDHLVGDFVFAVWDEDAGALTLARDHMGQRHVFFYAGETFFAFATEKKGLWALPPVPRVLPDAEIADTLVLGRRRRLSDGLSAPNPIKWLPGGTILTLAAAPETKTWAVTLKRYWEPNPDQVHLGRDEAYYLETYRKVLAEAVACRLRRATTPAGVLFSGGFDTASIAALAGPVLAPKGLRLVAASSVMPEDYQGTIHCPRAWIEVSRKHMPHLDVHYVTREGLDIFTDLEKAFYSADNFHSPGRYANDALYRAIASTGARVAMDGHGGDYTVNPTAQRYLIDRLARGQLRLFWREWRARRRFLNTSHWRLFRTAILQHALPGLRSMLLRRRGGLGAFGDATPINPAFLEDMNAGAPATPKRRSRRSQHALMKATLDHLHSASAMGGSISSASHGMEFTQPFHDKRVVELGLAIPEELWMKHGRERHLARTALADLLPPAFQTRPPGSEDLQPDFLAMAKRIEPRVLAEIDRMEQAGKLTRIFDFAQMRRLLTRRQLHEHRSGNEFDVRQGMRAFVMARYIEWFTGGNA
jgi:asparagine synthase (glutamine-hydrolysing)